MRINLCVGKIISAEHVPNKEKILKATVDVGSELRDIIVGAASTIRHLNLWVKLW
jgi:tRNA-binding EMAP/Myf-like protein